MEQAYNGLGQMANEYQSHSGAVVPGTTPQVQYQYNEMSNGENNSRLESMTYPTGRVLDYKYNAGLDDSISRLSSLSDNSAVLESYAYLGLGTVVLRAHPQTGVNLTYISPTNSTGDAGDRYTGLDRFGRIVDQLWLNTNTNTATDDFTYTYDRDSNVVSKNNQVNNAYNEQYTYDGFNQLNSYSRNNGQNQSWTLDALGNWISVTTNGNTQTRTANAQNQYTSLSGGTTPTYDNNGNLTTDPTNGNTDVYDAWNRLVAVKNGSNTLASYTYDAMNRRITESHSGTQTDLYYNDQWQVIEERSNGQPQTQYVWDPLASDTLVERDSNPNGSGVLTLRLYAQQDANGNVTALVDTSGNVVERFVYDPYGQVTVLSPSWSTLASDAYNWLYLFQAGRFDNATGLYDFRNRDYSPTLGRWLQQDPIGYLAGTNLYEFVQNSPTSLVDPLGLDAMDFAQDLAEAMKAVPGGDSAIPRNTLLPSILSKTFLDALMAAYNMGQAKLADRDRRVRTANLKEEMKAQAKWYNRLCKENQAIVKHYLQFFKRLPNANELSKAPECCKDKPFVRPKPRYVVKPLKYIYPWYATPWLSEVDVIVDTRTNKMVDLVDAGKPLTVINGKVIDDVQVHQTGKRYYPYYRMPGLFSSGKYLEKPE